MINTNISRHVMLRSYLITRRAHTHNPALKRPVGEYVSKENPRGWLGGSEPRTKLVSLEQGYSSEGHGETGFQHFSKGLC